MPLIVQVKTVPLIVKVTMKETHLITLVTLRNAAYAAACRTCIMQYAMTDLGLHAAQLHCHTLLLLLLLLQLLLAVAADNNVM